MLCTLRDRGLKDMRRQPRFSDAEETQLSPHVQALSKVNGIGIKNQTRITLIDHERLA